MSKFGISLIAFSSHYKFKYFLKYPFRYLIQLVTGSRMEHMGIKLMFDDEKQDLIYECTYNLGVHKTLMSERLNNLEHQIVVYEYEFIKKINKKQFDIIEKYLESKIGKKYSGIEALLSPLDFFKFKDDKNKFFCSELVCEAIKQVKIIPSSTKSNTLEPRDLLKLLNDNFLLLPKNEINHEN